MAKTLVFGKATDLVEQINEQIGIHGKNLTIAFYVDEATIRTSNDSVVGPIKAVDSSDIELTDPPRLDLEFKL